MIPTWLTARVAVLVAVSMLIAGLVANTYRLSAAVDREHAALVESQAAEKSLKESIDEQNGYIESWRQAAITNTARADAALDAANKAADARKRAIADLESWQRAAGENECTATRRLLLEYRK